MQMILYNKNKIFNMDYLFKLHLVYRSIIKIYMYFSLQWFTLFFSEYGKIEPYILI